LIGVNELECGIMDAGTELELEEIKDSGEYLSEVEESEMGFGRTRHPSELKVVSVEAKGKTVS
jgi:hypothetical protein